MHIKRLLNKNRTIKNANGILLLLILSVIIIAPLFPQRYRTITFSVLLFMIYITSVISIKQKRSELFVAMTIMLVVQPLSNIFDLEIINITARALNVLFFLLLVFSYVIEVSKATTVDRKVIFEAINVYLLLGIVFALLITILMAFNHHSFSFPFSDNMQDDPGDYFAEYIYYAFVTFTTLGYGEIVPLTPAARSLAMLAAVTGQIYLAVVIAMLVGKFSNRKND